MVDTSPERDPRTDLHDESGLSTKMPACAVGAERSPPRRHSARPLEDVTFVGGLMLRSRPDAARRPMDGEPSCGQVTLSLDNLAAHKRGIMTIEVRGDAALPAALQS
jgi:hypothetical protein